MSDLEEIGPSLPEGGVGEGAALQAPLRSKGGVGEGAALNHSSAEAEELARAEVYGLLARLFYAPPEPALHAQFAVAVTVAPVQGAFLEAGWSELVATARRLDPAAIGSEFDALFQGIGKPEIFLYGSYYLAGTLNEKPLAELRRALQGLGLERSAVGSETEDHIAALCEVMRYLIAGDDAGTSNLAAQRTFFDAHVREVVDPLCAAIEAHPRADFYRAVARFARDFFAVEKEAFDLLDE